ncbi:unnamed protein product, partial [Symbiodinium sp. CCMP2592]
MALLFCTVPTRVWAAPEGLSTVVAAAAISQQTAPEHFPTHRFELEREQAVLQQPPANRCISLPTSISLVHDDHCSWLGVTVFAPHAQPRYYAMPCDPGSRLDDVASQVLLREQATRPGYHFLSPVVPQRHPGFAAFVLHTAEDDRLRQVSVVVDLSHVGGHYYAASLPCGSTVADFLASVYRQTHVDDRPLRLWLPFTDTAAADADVLEPAHGDVLTVLWDGVQPLRGRRIQALFDSPRAWTTPSHMPTSFCTPGQLVFWQEETFFFHARFFPGLSMQQALSKVLKMPEARLSFHVSDQLVGVAFQGEACDAVIFVQEAIEFEAPAQAASRTPRTVPILCDARQVGRGLQVIAQSSPSITGVEVLLSLGMTVDEKYVVQVCTSDQHPSNKEQMRVVSVWEPHTRLFRPASAPNLLQRLYHDAADLHDLEADPPTDSEGDHGDPPSGSEAQADFSDSDSSEQPDGAHTVEATFMVFRMEYQPIELQVTLAMPSTLQACIDAVDGELDDYVTSPVLLPARPQLSQEWGAFVAVPRWAADEPHAVMDLRQYDGRLFVAPLPRVATPAHILRSAGAPDDGTLSVFPHGADRPLLPDEEVECTPGGTIAIVPTRQRPSARSQLTHMLLDPGAWAFPAFLPGGLGGLRSPYLCLVLEQGHRLHVLDNPPGEHLERLAARYGFPSHMTRAQVTRPRITDMNINGYHCKGVAAVSGDMPNVLIPPGRLRPGHMLAVVDCRPILQGWQLLATTDGTSDFQELVDLLTVFMPEGHRLHLDNIDLRGPLLHLQPGAVYVASYVPDRPATEEEDSDLLDDAPRGTPPHDLTPEEHGESEAPEQAQAVTVSMLQTEGNASLLVSLVSDPGPRASAFASLAAQPPTRGIDEQPEGPGSPVPVFTVPRPELDLVQEPAAAPFDASFCILTQDYWPELITVTLGADPSVSAALATVTEARAPAKRQAFPILIPVRPQASPGFATLLSVPAWQLPGVPVLFDCSRIDGRIFTALVADSMDLRSLLSVAEVVAAAGTLVYVADSPWPLEPGQVQPLQQGDLIMILPVEHDYLILSSLEDMLLDPHCWARDPALPVSAVRHFWILTDVESFRYPVTAQRRHFRRDVAEDLGCPPDRHDICVYRDRVLLDPHAHIVGLRDGEVIVVMFQPWPEAETDNEDMPSEDSDPGDGRATSTEAESVYPASDISFTFKFAISFTFKFATYNVLTLFDPAATKGRKVRAGAYGMMISGKRDLLKAQMQAQGLWALGLQETRLPEDAQLPDSDPVMLCSGATANGSYGCALWLDLRVAIAWQQGRPCYVTKDQLLVTSYSPRHLQVQVVTPWISLTILVAHGPSVDGADVCSARDFWSCRAHDLHKRPDNSQIVLLLDANSRLGSVCTAAVGGHDAETECAVGTIFHEFLHSVQCFVPSTFSQHHTGQSWTWVSPSIPPVYRRLDYIGVPSGWDGCDIKTSVWTSIEALQPRQDHFPVILCAKFGKAAPLAATSRAGRSPCRPPLDMSPSDRALYMEHLATSPNPAWQASVDHHFSCVVSDYRSAARLVQLQAPPKPRQCYLTPETLELVQHRAALRAYIKQEQQESSRRLVLIAFAALVSHTQRVRLTPGAATRAARWLAEIDVSIARAVIELRRSTQAIRVAVKVDRTAYLQGLAAQVSLCDLREPRKLFAAVRRAFPAAKTSKRSSFVPLPAIRLENGEMAATPEQRNQRWREYFGSQEAGQAVTDEQYVSLFQQPDIPVLPEGPSFCVRDLPTLLDLEEHLLSAKKGKAVGPDGLAVEAYQVCPGMSALKLYPLFLKSFLGKIYHKILRGKLASHLEAFKNGQQAGTSRGVGVDTISLMVRSFQGCMMRRSHSTAITFYDLKAAYYRVLRQVLLKSPDEDAALLRLLHQAGVPLQAVGELCQHLQSLATLAEAEVSGHLQSVVADLFRGSWFRLEPESLLTATHRGSRPGDPLADLLFGFCFASYLQSVELTLAQRGLSTAVPIEEHAAPWHSWEVPSSIQHASWADDYAHLQQAPEAPDLELVVVQAVQVHLERASSVGMALTFAADKTATLLPLTCTRAPLPVTPQNPKGLPGLFVQDDITGLSHFLPIVDSYRHLGGVVTANCTPSVDIAYRFSMASAVLRPLRRRLFATQSVPLTTRIVLLRSLVISRFVFACAVVDLNSAIHRRTWCRHYVELWGALQKTCRPQDRPHSFRLLLQADAPSPLLALALSRAVFLKRLLTYGPAAVLHLLHIHWRTRPMSSWLTQLCKDMQAVAVYVPAVTLLLNNGCPVTALVEAVQDNPNWWPSQIKLAIKAYKQDLRAWAQKAESAQDAPAPVQVGSLPFKCRWCSATFALHKAVALHESRKHGSLCPARHYSQVPWCIACLKYCHTLERVQYHLRRSRECLLRSAHLVPPLSIVQIREGESDEALRRKKIKHGGWQCYSAATPVLQCQGPLAPTYHEAIEGLDEDELTLERLKTLFRPLPETVAWVEESVNRESKEGARSGTADFWLQ